MRNGRAQASRRSTKRLITWWRPMNDKWNAQELDRTHGFYKSGLMSVMFQHPPRRHFNTQWIHADNKDMYSSWEFCQVHRTDWLSACQNSAKHHLLESISWNRRFSEKLITFSKDQATRHLHVLSCFLLARCSSPNVFNLKNGKEQILLPCWTLPPEAESPQELRSP